MDISKAACLMITLWYFCPIFAQIWSSGSQQTPLFMWLGIPQSSQALGISFSLVYPYPTSHNNLCLLSKLIPKFIPTPPQTSMRSPLLGKDFPFSPYPSLLLVRIFLAYTLLNLIHLCFKAITIIIFILVFKTFYVYLISFEDM